MLYGSLRMELGNVRVLIDSQNLALRHGTGIKTYGLTLLAALKRLGISTDLLAGASWHPNPVLARSLLHEVPPAYQDSYYFPISERLRHWFGVARVAHPVPSQKELPFPIPDTLFPFGHGCATFPYIYEISQRTQELFNFPGRFKTDTRYDVWHATTPLPMVPQGMRQITTVHDLIPLLQPHTCPANRPAFVEHIKLAIRNSQVIAAVSEHSRRDLLNYFDVPEEKVQVTHQPTLLENWQGTDASREMVMRELDLRPGGYILFVGNIEPKKNVGRLLNAFLSLDCDLPLIITGHKAWMWEDELAPLRRASAARRVRLLGYLDGDWIPYLYESAYCSVFPSIYEGFGLPVLEAMTMGCPVVCSRSASLPEVGGDAVEYVDALDTDSIASGIARLLNDRFHRDLLSQQGRERARHFSMENYVPKVARLYEKALS